MRPWTLRTMIVYDTNMLRYYDGSKLKGEISLHGTVVHNLSPEQADGREHAFAISNITGLGRSKVAELVLAAGTKVEVDEWIAAIRGATTVTDTFAYQSLKVIAIVY